MTQKVFFTHTHTHLWVAVSADVHLCEGADISDAHHLHGEVAQEVDDLQGLAPEAEDEDEGRDDRTQQLLQYKDLRSHGFS